jgi:hypothetical protein
MVNIEHEASIIAHSIDKPFDFALKRRLIDTIITGRALLLHRSMARNNTIPPECIQSFAVPIVKAESFSLYYIDNFKASVRTREPIPTPIRMTLDVPFISVSSLDGSINFSYSDITTVRTNSHAGKFVSKTGRYIYHGEHLGLYHNEPILLTQTMVLVRGIMENPLKVRDYANHYTYSEDNFPMPMDMAMDIRQMILKGELTIQPESQTVPINGK